MDESDKLLEQLTQRMEGAGIQVQRMKIKESQVFCLTARELLAACDKFNSHPHAKLFRDASANLPPEQEVCVDKVDLEAMLRGKTVTIQHDQEISTEGGRQIATPIERKILN